MRRTLHFATSIASAPSSDRYPESREVERSEFSCGLAREEVNHSGPYVAPLPRVRARRGACVNSHTKTCFDAATIVPLHTTIPLRGELIRAWPSAKLKESTSAAWC